MLSPSSPRARTYHGLPAGRRERRGERRIGSRGRLGRRSVRRRRRLRSFRWRCRGGVCRGGGGGPRHSPELPPKGLPPRPSGVGRGPPPPPPPRPPVVRRVG